MRAARQCGAARVCTATGAVLGEALAPRPGECRHTHTHAAAAPVGRGACGMYEKQTHATATGTS